MAEHKIEGEHTYPIYSVKIRWTQDVRPDYEPSKWQIEDLPEGRIHNGTAFSQMYKEGQDIETLRHKIENEWIPKYFNPKTEESRYPITNPKNIEITIKFVRHETWCLEWFCHFTFDDGRSDKEYLASFERFVRRMQKLDEKEYCLMGADDRWRWKGLIDDGKETPPPCRCAGCKKAGVVRINH